MRLAVQVSGEGPRDLVLLHGLFGQARNLGVIARLFAPSFRVISLDLRNHGASAHADGMGYAVMAADLWETLDALGVKNPLLIGHSMGGKAAMMAALLRPDAVRGLAVIDVAPKIYDHHNARIAQALMAIPLDREMRRSDADAVLARDVESAVLRGFLLQNFLPGEQPGWRIGLAQIERGVPELQEWPAEAVGKSYNGPCLFVAGGESDYIKEADMPQIRSLFGHAELRVIAGAGHWVHGDRPQELGEILVAFVEGIG